MNILQIEVVRCNEKPDYSKTASELLKRCQDFYQDPENEKAFQEWLAEKNHGRRCS